MNTHNIYLSATTNILIKFTDDSDGNIWYLKNGYIMNKKYKSFLYLNKNKLMLSKTKKNIIYFNDRLKHKNNELYLSTCYNYKIKFVPDRINSIHISNEFIDNTYFKLYYTKTQLELDFYKNNISMDINLNTGTQNIAVLLCAGTSSRFSSNIPKQLFIIDNLSVIEKCIISFNNTNIFKIILVTNSNIYEQIRDIVKKYNNIDILINDINCRLESIHTAIKYIKTTNNTLN